MRDWFGLTVRPSAVTHALHRAARHAAPTYRTLRDQIRGSPVVSPDETSWKVAGELWWLWAFATPETVVYAIQAGRGFPEAAAVLGADYAGVLVRDGWAPYRQFAQAPHQTCLAHLLRRSHDVAEAHPHSPWPQAVHDVLQEALAVRDRFRAGTITAHGVAVARGHLITRLLTLLDTPGLGPDCQRFAKHLTTELPALFGFLFDLSLDATQLAGRAGDQARGGQSQGVGRESFARGAQTQEILTSVIQTARLRDLQPRDILVDLLHAPTPVPSSPLSRLQ
ncbi:MAG TPA: transposase [Vicinamibacterales bacterium]